MGSMVYASFQPTKEKSAHMHGHVGPESPAWTATTQEPYYSNEDIEILHEIVTEAQEKLDRLGGPRLLPATALFKAYDEILPKHGIDPDDENHLSRLIFRVGGEKGLGSLPNKFQTVLASMGISLEYGSGSPASVRDTQSTQSSVHGDVNKDLEIITKKADVQRKSVGVHEPVSAPTNLSEYDAESANMTQYQADIEQPVAQSPLTSQDKITFTGPADEGIDKPPEVNTEIPLTRSALSHPPVLAILDRWRKRNQQNDRASELPHKFVQPKPADLLESKLVTNGNYTNKSRSNCIENSPTSSKRALKNSDQRLDVAHLPTSSAHIPQPTLQNQTEEQCSDYNSIMQRAARTREIYLASRTFNHWAERTAARLEKEAVARRHMIRFRCFRGWSQAPSSRLPAVNHLRTVTAVQKLQRAIACQEEQLRIAASTIAESHRIQTAQRTVSRWLCSTTEQKLIRKRGFNTKRNIARSWKELAAAQKKFANSTKAAQNQSITQRYVASWASQTQNAEKQLAASRYAGLVRPFSAYLEAWLSHSEAQKKVEICKAKRLWTRAYFVLDHWNLRARAQAFTWRSDYQNATSAVDRWSAATRSAMSLSRNATIHHGRYSASLAMHQSEDFASYASLLETYAKRARLYVMAKSLLRVLDHAHEARKLSRREEVRQQLRARYKEASSARKKRQFYSVLERWRSSSQDYASMNVEAEKHHAEQRAAMNSLIVQSWDAAAKRHDEHHWASQKYAANGVLTKWAQISSQLAEQEAESRDSWMQRNQWQALKLWSISSLQGSGRAHTATMVQHRYEADKKTRAFTSWKTTCLKVKVKGADPSHASATPRSYLGFSGRSSWRALSSRQPSKLQKGELKNLNTFTASAAQLDTPTRWTGRALAISSSIARPMAPVKEADEQSITASSLGDEGDMDPGFALDRASTRQSLRRSLVMRPSTIASTTPHAPVPALRRSVYASQPAVNNALPFHLKQSFKPSATVRALPQGAEEQSQRGFADSTFEASNVSRTEPRSQNAQVSDWQGPATPNKVANSIAATQESTELARRTTTAKTAPLPSRINSQQRHDSRVLRGTSDQISFSSAGRWK